MTVSEREELYDFYIANNTENTLYYLYLHYSNRFLNKIAKFVNEMQQSIGYYELTLVPSLSSFAIVTPFSYVESSNNLTLNNLLSNFSEEVYHYFTLNLKLLNDNFSSILFTNTFKTI
jgi:hypothetical protein